MSDFGWVRSPLLWLALLPAGFLILLFVVSVMERRLVRPFVPARRRDVRAGTRAGAPLPLNYGDDTPDPSQVSPYVALMSGRLAAAGFEFGGIFAHAKPRIRVLAALWWSSQRDVLALTGSGTVWNIPSHQSWLFTPLRDGRLLVTTDNNDEGDLSGLYVMRRVLNVPMDEMLAAHRRRLARVAGETAVFSEASPADALAAISDRRLERLIARHLARYADEGQTVWHYTGWGGFLGCLDFFRQFFGALPQFWRVHRGPVADPKLMPLGRELVPLADVDTPPGQPPPPGPASARE